MVLICRAGISVAMTVERVIEIEESGSMEGRMTRRMEQLLLGGGLNLNLGSMSSTKSLLIGWMLRIRSARVREHI